MLKIRWGRHREPLVGNEVCSIEGRPVKICRSFARAGPRHTWLSAGDNWQPYQCVRSGQIGRPLACDELIVKTHPSGPMTSNES
jgi:hypothetical protein